MAELVGDITAKHATRRTAVLVAVVLAAFLAVITFSLRGSFWSSQDYGMLSLSHAIHLEWRLSHGESFPAPGLAGHPGIPFYFASWLAVALVVPSFSVAGFDRFSEIIANAEPIYVANQVIAITLVALSSYAFVRVATRVVPIGVALAALGLWLGSTYQAILTSTSLSIETFALPLNVLFLWILLRLAASPKISTADAIMAGLIAALGYLMKLPYLYVACGLGAACLTSAFVHRVGIVQGLRSVALIAASCVLCVAAVGYSVIGEAGLNALLIFHKNVLFHSGHYGTGEIGLLQASHAKAALDSFLYYGSFAPWAALMFGSTCTVFALTGRRTRKAPPSEVILGVGAGVAALFAAIGVLKHFAEHYSAGVASTLPAVVIALFLLVNKVHPSSSRRFGFLMFILLAFGFSYSLYFAAKYKLTDVARRFDGQVDRRQLHGLLEGKEGRAIFTYHVLQPEFGEGFILYYSGIPMLQKEYRVRDQSRASSYASPIGSFKYVVVDKAYFPDMARVRSASNLDPVGSVQVTAASADQIVELRCCFVVIKPQPILLPAP